MLASWSPLSIRLASSRGRATGGRASDAAGVRTACSYPESHPCQAVTEHGPWGTEGLPGIRWSRRGAALLQGAAGRPTHSVAASGGLTRLETALAAHASQSQSRKVGTGDHTPPGVRNDAWKPHSTVFRLASTLTAIVSGCRELPQCPSPGRRAVNRRSASSKIYSTAHQRLGGRLTGRRVPRNPPSHLISAGRGPGLFSISTRVERVCAGRHVRKLRESRGESSKRVERGEAG